MHASKVAAILAFCAAQGFAAPALELAVERRSGPVEARQFQPEVLLPTKRTVIETTSTGDAATDAKVADELKQADPKLQAGLKELASEAQYEKDALPNLLDALEAAVQPLLAMADTMETEAQTIKNAEADAETAAPVTAPVTGSTTGSTTSTLSRRDPLLGLIAPVLDSVGKLVSKRQEMREVERRRLSGNAIGGLVDGFGNLGGSIIGLFDKRDEVERRRLSGNAIGGLVDGFGNLGGSIIGLFD